MARLAALVPNRRVNLARYHGVFAPNHHLREQVTPARRGRRHAARAQECPVDRHAAMTWARRLKRVFKIEIETCEICGGQMKVIAAIEDPSVIKRILTHLDHGPGAEQHPETPTPRPAATHTARLNGGRLRAPLQARTPGEFGFDIGPLARRYNGRRTPAAIQTTRRQVRANCAQHPSEFPLVSVPPLTGRVYSDAAISLALTNYTFMYFLYLRCRPHPPQGEESTSTLQGKTPFITGASRGIGLAIALRAARDGANVVVAAKTSEANPKLPGTNHSAAAQIEAAGGHALALQADIRDEASVREAVARAVAHFGAIDVLVNNASAISLTSTPATPMKRFDLMFGVNVRGHLPVHTGLSAAAGEERAGGAATRTC